MTDQERKDIQMMVSSGGWALVEKWISEKIKQSSNLNCIPMDGSDEKILSDLRLAQSRRHVYQGVLDFVKKGAEDGRRNDGR